MGPCGVITAFNFPVAVWAWNTALALVCGNPVIWMLSEKTPLSALVTMKIMERALARFGNAPDGLIQLVIGAPRADGILIGPLIDQGTSDRMQAMLESAKAEGGTVHGGGVAQGIEGGCYVNPAIVEMPGQTDIVRTEIFAPILYVMGYSDFDEAMALQNGVPQGLSSCIFTLNMREAEQFLSAAGSDCGIANVNIGPSGAEIGGAFGGEKETGDGRESGSDAWKGYMRRQTNTINYSAELPLAQGVKFNI